MLDGLLPLLQAVEPQDLATTLGALSQALAGRGEDLGQTLVRLQELTGGLRPAIPDLQADITQLADFAGNVNEAAPDLLDALDDFSATSRTIVEQRQQLHDLLTGVTSASDDLRGFLAANRGNLIALADTSRPTLESLARYSPEFPCLLDQLAGLVPRIDKAFGAGTDRAGAAHHAGDRQPAGQVHAQPGRAAVRGRPRPALLPDPPARARAAAGRPVPGRHRAGPAAAGRDARRATPTTSAARPSGPTRRPTPGWACPTRPASSRSSPSCIAAQDGTSPAAVPAWSSMLVGPLYRGTEVTLT